MALAFSACANPDFRNPLDPSGSAFIAPPGAGSTLINDYERGAFINSLNYCPETFTDASGRATVFPSLTSLAADAYRGNGSLRLDFDVTSGDAPFGGYVELLTGNDPCPSSRGLFNLQAAGLSALTFAVRRGTLDVNVEIAIKSIDDIQTTPKVLLSSYGVTGTSWGKVRIPITDLAPGQNGRSVDLRNLREVNFGFAKQRFSAVGAAVRGTVFIDDLAFER